MKTSWHYAMATKYLQRGYSFEAAYFRIFGRYPKR